MKKIWLVLIVLGSVLTVNAQQANAWALEKTRPKGDANVPAAPEPAQVLLLASGLTLVGGYIAWRRRKQRE